MPARPHAAFHGLRRRVKQSAAGAISGGAFSFFVTAKSFRFSRKNRDFHIAILDAASSPRVSGAGAVTVNVTFREVLD